MLLRSSPLGSLEKPVSAPSLLQEKGVAADKETNEFYPLITEGYGFTPEQRALGFPAAAPPPLPPAPRMSGWWRGRPAPAIPLAVVVQVLGFVRLPQIRAKQGALFISPAVHSPSGELPMAKNCQASPELYQKLLTPHLTQIAAWPAAPRPLTHSNAITASGRSARGAGGCGRSPETEPLPSGRPRESRTCREGVHRPPAARRTQSRVARDPGPGEARGHRSPRRSPGRKQAMSRFWTHACPGRPLSRPLPA